jgi:hypothetical protein
MQKYKKFITSNTNNRKKLNFLFLVSVSVELSSPLNYLVHYLLTFITKERKVSFFLLFVLGVLLESFDSFYF